MISPVKAEQLVRMLGVLTLLLAFPVWTGAQPLSETPSIDEFQSANSVNPPSLPATVSGKEGYQVTIVMETAEGELIRNAHAVIRLRNERTGKETGSLQFTTTGKVDLRLDKGSWAGTIGIDEVSELGSDYFGILQFTSMNASRTVAPQLVRVGNVRGEVYGNDGKLVRNARIEVECKQLIEPAETDTNEFGVFFSEYITQGECRIAALHAGKVGFVTVNVEAGKTVQVVVELNKEIAKAGSRVILVALAVIILALIIGVAYTNRDRTKILEKKEKTVHKADGASRLNDIVKTLKNREKTIVRYLMDNGKEATQAKIIHGTGIPKTSVMRILDSLTARNIVEVRKYGKAKKIRLAYWLLGKRKTKESRVDHSGP